MNRICLKVSLGWSILALCFFAVPAASAPKEGSKDTIRVVHASPTKYPKQVWANTFKELVEKNSNGKITVKIYPQGQLYKDSDGMVALAQGALEIFITSSGHLPTWSKKWSIYSFPGLFYGFQHAYRFMDSQCCEALLTKILEPKGVKVLGQYAIGPTTIFTTKQINSIEDLKGLKIRSTKNPVTVAALDALHIGGVSLGVADTYTALQQGMVDGDATPLTTHMTHKWNDIAKYNFELPLSFGVNVPTASLKWWNQLPKDTRQFIEKVAIVEATKRTRAYAEESLNRSKKEAMQKGMVFTEVSQSEMKKLDGLMDPIYDKYGSQVGKPLIDCARKAK